MNIPLKKQTCSKTCFPSFLSAWVIIFSSGKKINNFHFRLRVPCCNHSILQFFMYKIFWHYYIIKKFMLTKNSIKSYFIWSYGLFFMHLLLVILLPIKFVYMMPAPFGYIHRQMRKYVVIRFCMCMVWTHHNIHNNKHSFICRCIRFYIS